MGVNDMYVLPAPFLYISLSSPFKLSHGKTDASVGLSVTNRYLHHHLTTPQPGLFDEDRIALIWAVLRARHPLLASEVVKQGEKWSFR